MLDALEFGLMAAPAETDAHLELDRIINSPVGPEALLRSMGAFAVTGNGGELGSEGTDPASAGGSDGDELPADIIGTPPGAGGRPETGEAGRELIGQCDFYDYYLYRHGDHSDERLAATAGFMKQIERGLGADGVKVRLLLSEIRSNYYEHCIDDINKYYREGAKDPEGDDGHRELVVTRDTRTGVIYIDYKDPCPVTATTYNAYAGPFGQELEPVSEEEAAMFEARRLREEMRIVEEDDLAGGNEWLKYAIADQAQKRGESADEAIADAGVDDNVMFGSASEGGTSGRGIPLMLQEGLEEGGKTEHFIRRFGERGRGTHLHLVLPPDQPS